MDGISVSNVPLHLNHFALHFDCMFFHNHVITDECYWNFELLFDSSHKLVSGCVFVSNHTDVSIDTCKLLACDKSANTITYDAELKWCTLRDCKSSDPKVIAVDEGLEIYQIKQLLSRHSSIKIALNGKQDTAEIVR